MERLITKYEEENVPKEICTINRFGEADDCSSCAEICEECNSDCENCAIQKCFNKLADYEDAEEQGLLKRFPCPVGTTVYKFEPTANNPKKYIETIVKKYDVYENEIWFCFANGLGRNIKDFGKYVFLTREEANQALADMGV